MLQKIDKKNKIYIYLFIFLLLSTFNNINIINFKLLKFNIEQIKVSGLTKKNNLEVSQEIKKKLIENIFFIRKEFLTKILQKNNLINSFEIKKIYPNIIEIKIKKTEFLGITNIDGNFFFIGSNGKLIDYNESEKNLPYVFGKININDYIEFVKFVNKSKFSFNIIEEIYFFPSGRWDIKTFDDKLFKLPAENIELKLNLIYELYKNENFKNIKVIDLRFKNKIINSYE